MALNLSIDGDMIISFNSTAQIEVSAYLGDIPSETNERLKLIG